MVLCFSRLRWSHERARRWLTIEALSIATEVLTAAVMEIGLALTNGIATGTGTDFITIAPPPGPQDYAGLHTEIGEAIGAAVCRATLLGAQQWKTIVKPEQLGVIKNARSRTDT